MAAKAGHVSLGTLPEGVHFVRAVAVSGSGMPSAMTTAAVRVDAHAPRASRSTGVPAGWSNAPVRLTARASDPLSGMAAAGAGWPLHRDRGRRRLRRSPRARRHGRRLARRQRAPRRPLLRAGRRRQHRRRRAWLAADPDRDGRGSTKSRRASPSPRPRTRPTRSGSRRLSATRSPARARSAARSPSAAPGPAPACEPLPTSGREPGRLIAHWDSDAYPPGKYEFLATGYRRRRQLAPAAATGPRAVGWSWSIPLKTQVDAAALGSRVCASAARLRRDFGGGPLAGPGRSRSPRPSPPAPSPTATNHGRSTDARRELLAAPQRRPEPRGRRPLRRHAACSAEPVASRTISSFRRPVRLRASATVAAVGGRADRLQWQGRARRREPRRSAVSRSSCSSASAAPPGASSAPSRPTRRGRFRYAYRFSDDDSRGVRFQFRAYVKGREGWPYRTERLAACAVVGGR